MGAEEYKPRCEMCGTETEHLSPCPYSECEDTRELCTDCLFEHMCEHATPTAGTEE